MSNDLLTDVRNSEGPTSFVGQPSPPSEPPVLWTYKVVYPGLGEIADPQELYDQQFIAPRYVYRSWAAVREAAAKECEGEAEDLRTNPTDSGDGDIADEYDEAAAEIRALDEPKGSFEGDEYICTMPGFARDYRLKLEGLDLIVFFYNMTLED